MELYWNIAAGTTSCASIAMISYLLHWMVKPFLQNKRAAVFAGTTHFATMMIMYFIPPEINGMVAHAAGVLVAFIVMYALDRRNWEQKIFLCFTIYLLNWISHGIAILLRDAGYGIFNFFRVEQQEEWVQFAVFVFLSACYVLIRFLCLKLFVYMVNRAYGYKQENMTGKELALMLSTPLSVLAGYCAFQFFSEIYLLDSDQYIWRVHMEYWWIKVIYQLVSFVAILLSVVTYQKIKSSHKKEREDAILIEQMDHMKEHIAEVEARYAEIRRLKHDMGNHVVTLENLVLKKQPQEAEKYLVRLKKELWEVSGEESSGNPVVDVILKESRRRAEERGICFMADFHYPGDAAMDAFDLSVILNNTINNAIEGCDGSDHPQIQLVSYRKKNAYMIECANSFVGEIYLEEGGLPITSKKDAQEHGYGLISIRNVAQKYYGDIDIRQKNGKFILSIMLMLR